MAPKGAKKLNNKMGDELKVEMDTIIYSCSNPFDAGGDDSVLMNKYMEF